MNQEKCKDQAELQPSGEGTCGLCAITPTCPPARHRGAGPITTFSFAVRPGPLVRSAWTVCAGGNDLVRSSALYGGRNPTQQSCSSTYDRFSLRLFNVVQPYYTTRTFPRHQRLLVRTQAGPPAFRLVQHVTYRQRHAPAAAREDGHWFQVSVYATNYNVLQDNVRMRARLRVRIAYGYQWL
jgi:hypothetical protein